MSRVQQVFSGINRVAMAMSGAILFLLIAWFYSPGYFNTNSLVVRATPEKSTIAPWLMLVTLVVFGIVFSARWTAWSRTAPLLQSAMSFYVGWEFLGASGHKLRSPSWLTNSAGLHAFWTHALTPAKKGVAAAAYTNPRFGAFLHYANSHEWYTWFSKLIVLGEVAVGLGLIFGAFVGLASLGAVAMNLSFLQAGSISSNPGLLMLGVAIFVMQAILRRQASFLGVENAVRTWWENRGAVSEVVVYEPRPAYMEGEPKAQPSSAD